MSIWASPCLRFPELAAEASSLVAPSARVLDLLQLLLPQSLVCPLRLPPLLSASAESALLAVVSQVADCSAHLLSPLLPSVGLLCLPPRARQVVAVVLRHSRPR